MTNLSDKPCKLSYTISIKPHEGREVFSWTDPDGKLLFDKAGGPDSSWGNEEFIDLNELREQISLSRNGIIMFEMTITIYSNVHLNDQPMTRMIENAGLLF